MNLEQLILPMSRGEFLEGYRGKKHFIVNGDPSRFQHLFTWEKMADTLFSHRFEFPRLRLIKDGVVVDPSLFLDLRADKRGSKFSKVNFAKLEKQLSKGTAMHILSVQEFSKDLTEICNSIGNELSTDTEMTIHIGMKKSHGFDLHWDAHDVFVMQLYGKKHWKLYGFTEQHPYRMGPSVSQKGPTVPIWEGDLVEGDVLYIPRGCWHVVEAYDEACMHISLGMYNPKRVDYITWLTKMMYEFEFFRKDMDVLTNDVPTEEEIERLRMEVNGLISKQTYRKYLQQFKVEKNRGEFIISQFKS